MGYVHSMMLVAKVKHGTSIDALAKAFAPLLDDRYPGENPFHPGVELYSDDTFIYDQEIGDVDVSTGGDVGYGFDDIAQNLADSLSASGLLVEAGSIWLYNRDTGDIDNAKSVFYFGPTEEAKLAYAKKANVDAAVELLKPFASDDVITQIRNLLK